MARILITGGAGFIGSHLCERFLADGDDVICMDNLLTGAADNIAHLFANRRFSFIQQDVTTYIYVKGAVDAILHFASPASPTDFARLPELLAMQPPPQPGAVQERPELPEREPESEPRMPDLPELEPVAVPLDDRQMGLF